MSKDPYNSKEINKFLKGETIKKVTAESTTVNGLLFKFESGKGVFIGGVMTIQTGKGEFK